MTFQLHDVYGVTFSRQLEAYLNLINASWNT